MAGSQIYVSREDLCPELQSHIVSIIYCCIKISPKLSGLNNNLPYPRPHNVSVICMWDMHVGQGLGGDGLFLSSMCYHLGWPEKFIF